LPRSFVGEGNSSPQVVKRTQGGYAPPVRLCAIIFFALSSPLRCNAFIYAVNEPSAMLFSRLLSQAPL